MRILFISNLSTERCGVRAFGEEMAGAIRRAGHAVVEWDGTYGAVTQHGYLPPDAASYDIVHLNWDPQAINHYLPVHFAGLENRLSLWLHDVPPNSTCPVHGVARWVGAHEPGERILVIPHAVPPTPEDLPDPYLMTIGVSGIRADPGAAQVKALCRKRGWAYNPPYWWDGGPWLSNDDEIRRLSRSTVNVCWYHTTGRGKSMSAMFCLAARRPLVVSPSTMFSGLWDYSDELVRGYALSDDALACAVDFALDERRIAVRAPQALAWDRVIRPMIDRWEAR